MESLFDQRQDRNDKAAIATGLYVANVHNSSRGRPNPETVMGIGKRANTSHQPVERREKGRKKRSNSKSRILQYVLETLSVLILLAVFVPFKPDLPGIGNDASWRLAINQAVAQGLVFGEDIVYTYGPYGSILTQMYHPATAGLMFWGALLLGCCYSLLLLSMGRAMGRWWMAPVYAVICAGLMYPHEAIKDGPRDALLSSYPLLLALFIYRITTPALSKGVFSYRLNALLATLFLPLGLLPIVKPSFLFISAIVTVGCLVLLLENNQKTTAVLCAFTPPVFMVLLWRVGG
jgi:hypothetical protein